MTEQTKKMSIEEKIEQLGEVASEDEWSAIQKLSDKVGSALVEGKNNPIESAKKDLDKAVNKLYKQYYKDQDRLKDRLAALRYLEKKGYKVSKSKLYKDAESKSGPSKLKMQPDGSILVAEAKLYAHEHLKHLDPAKNPDELEKLRAEEQKYKILRLKNTCRDQEFAYERLMGKYVPKNQLARELATRAAVLDAGLSAMVKACASQWIQMVDGDFSKDADLISLFKRHKDELLRAYANAETLEVLYQVED